MRGRPHSSMDGVLTENHKRPGQISNEGESGAVAEQPQSESILRVQRRKFITGGLAAAPFVAATLSNRSALAATTCTASGIGSATPSRQMTENCVLSPGWWHKQDHWPDPGSDETPSGLTWPIWLTPYTKFSEIFGNPSESFPTPPPTLPSPDEWCYYPTGGVYTDPTCDQALPPNGGDSQYLIWAHDSLPGTHPSLPGHAVAAFCNTIFLGTAYGWPEAPTVVDFFKANAGTAAGNSYLLTTFSNWIDAGVEAL